LLLDELEKMSRKDQNVLLNVIETGMLVETKVSKTRSRQMKNLKVFATTNNVNALSAPLRSRFMEFHLPQYTFDQFSEIARRLLAKRLGHSNQVADEIVTAVWNEMNGKDIRDVLAIAKLVHSVDDVSWLVKTFRKYGKIPGRIDNSYGDMA
jgi:replication-associated recombination protein RarA